MKTPYLLVCAAVLAGCAAQERATVPEMLDASRPLICEGAEQCQLAWRRAQLWIVQNSAWKIQTATDVVIQTFNGDPYTPLRSYTVTREPQGAGKDEIRIESACRNSYGCHGDGLIAAARFKRFVLAGMQ